MGDNSSPASALLVSTKSDSEPQHAASTEKTATKGVEHRDPTRELPDHGAAPKHSNCPFFDLLPWDIRYHIYQLAFGGLVIHMYLLYQRGLQSTHRWRRGHGPIADWVPNSPSVSLTDPFGDATVSPQWYWWSCVCGPDVEVCTKRGTRGSDAARRSRQMTLRDACPTDFVLATDVERTILGISGWLRSCRQAYKETARLLYATNTFKLDQQLEAVYFPLSLTEQQLAWITSINIRIHAKEESLYAPSIDDARDPYHAGPSLSELRSWTNQQRYRHIVEGMHVSFPALRSLHVSFECSARAATWEPERPSLMIPSMGVVAIEDLEGVVLEPLDALPGELERRILLYRSVYAVLRSRAMESGAFIEQESGCAWVKDRIAPWRRFWRSLEHRHGRGAGYWIYERR